MTTTKHTVAAAIAALAASLSCSPIAAGHAADRTTAARAAALPPPPITSPHSAPFRNDTQAPSNSAGAIWHPYGDYFAVWDNVRDGIPVQVWYRYATSHRWHRFVSRQHYHVQHVPVREYPHQLVFLIDGHNNRGDFVRSAESRYRTYGE